MKRGVHICVASFAPNLSLSAWIMLSSFLKIIMDSDCHYCLNGWPIQLRHILLLPICLAKLAYVWLAVLQTNDCPIKHVFGHLSSYLMNFLVSAPKPRHVSQTVTTYFMNALSVRTKTFASFTIWLSFSLKTTAFFTIWSSSHNSACFRL